jgi:hypothetical protein
LSAGGNYTVTYVGNNLVITPRTLTVTATPVSKLYGSADPTLTYTHSTLYNSDTNSVFTGSLSRDAGENVGTYTIHQNTLGAGSNYSITYIPANFDIIAAAINLAITADAQSKVYGDADPVLTYTHGALLNGDTDSVFTGSLARMAGGNVGSYAITLGTLSAGPNYVLSFTGNSLTITPRTLIVTVLGQSAPFGSAVPGTSVTYDGFVNGENSSALTTLPTIASAHQGTAVPPGFYAGNYTAYGAYAANYRFSYVPGDLTITGAPASPAGNLPSTFTTTSQGVGLNTAVYKNWSVDPTADQIVWLTPITASANTGSTSFLGSAANIPGESVWYIPSSATDIRHPFPTLTPAIAANLAIDPELSQRLQLDQ